MGVGDLIRARDRLLAADEAGLAVGPVCEEIIRAFHDVAGFDRCALMTTDPETLLPSSGVAEGFEPGDCAPAWDNELLDPDFNKYGQLARSQEPVASLFEAVDGDLARSPRYRKLYAGIGAADELRVAFVAGGSCVAVGVFVRPGPAGPFTAAELVDVRQLVPVATTVLRRALGRLSEQATNEPPVVIVLDDEGRVTAMTAGGRTILEGLRTMPEDDGPPDVVTVPSMILAAATKARWSRSTTHLTTRVRNGDGRWLRVHVSPVEGEVGAVAVLVETARPGDLVPILLDAYGLTHRETEIVRLLARGLPLKDVAAELVISVHTVRDHVKAIYEKAGVNSRGELVATLFSRHLFEQFHTSVTRLSAPPG